VFADVKNKRGQHARGKKITGLSFVPGRDPSSSAALLISSNDSRIRLYDGYTLRTKYKGHHNSSTQIRASFSPKGDYIICGSDDGAVYIWSTAKTYLPGSPERPTESNRSRTGAAVPGEAPSQSPPKEKNASYESFQAAGDVVTVALFAPECTHRTEESMSPTAAATPLSAEFRNVVGALQGAGPAGRGAEVALLNGAQGSARGQVIVTSGYGGEIRIYENVGLPQWL